MHELREGFASNMILRLSSSLSVVVPELFRDELLDTLIAKCSLLAGSFLGSALEAGHGGFLLDCV